MTEDWPLSKLATLSDEEMLEPTADKPLNPPAIHTLSSPPKLGRIVLQGSGHGLPAPPNLLTDQILTIHADPVLANKLVPKGVLDLMPRKTELIIAKKFPGMHESQEETMHLIVEGARKRLYIVAVCSLSQYLSCHQLNPTMKLKQGDSPVYNHSSERVLFFRAQEFEPLLVSGISSALAGPTFGGIPLTHPSVAGSVVVWGVGNRYRSIKAGGCWLF